jgi:hypothetical protein
MRLLMYSTFALLLATGAGAAPAPGDPAEEIAQLKKRVDELENQNCQMTQLLAALVARLDRPSEALAVPSAAAVAHSALPSSPAPVPPPAQTKEAGSPFRLYGMLRLDIDIDTQRPNSPQTPLFITSPGGGKGGDFAMHPRLTRVGLDFNGPSVAVLGNAEFTGKLETDFENGGSESRQIIRIRHAYMKSTWGSFSLLAGQTWDVFSPLFPTVNNDTLMWNAGNLGDRRPQVRAAYAPKVGKGQFSLDAAIGLTGAVDALDLDGNGYADGMQSMRPNVQSRIGYSRPLWVAGQPFAVGGSVFSGWLETSHAIGGRLVLPMAGYNADYTLPVSRFLTLRGEGWWGRNMSDFRGGAGQSVTVSTGRVVRGRGGWSEAKIRLSRYWSLVPGFTTDNPVKADLVSGNRQRNRAFYLGNRFTPGGKLEFGVDYFRWHTDYLGLLPAIDNRINIFFQYGF